jgi:DNA repair protein RadC
MSSEDTPEGHRKRLRERFIKGGLTGFADYEVVELLLSLGTPRRDCKPQAKEAIKKFKNLRGVLSASIDELQQIEGIGPHSAFGIKLMHDLAGEYLKEQLIGQPCFESSKQIFEYLYHSMRDLKNEVFKVIYLNSNNQILDTSDLFEGTVNSAAVAPRKIVEEALGHRATALIFAHNHPAGFCEPSKNDKDITRDLVFAGGTVQIKILDHLIIGDNRYYSFAGEGLISKYEMEFLGMRLKGGG